ncbi:MAG: 5-formyltetrahydrofolate cyclo-ligase [Fusobacteria bacterium]|nr:MAG: 5-formyltetrahydrofolate cyclo-ligase [Fusobacteriota bacterium]KAF0230259.1 MAG: 5-formyltetrahydrofolate [Fusobacteriota bacterium]
MKTIIEQKKEVRKSIQLIKRNLTDEYLSSASKKITNDLIKTKAFIKANTIMCYLSFGTEVNTAPIINECYKQGKTILIPIIMSNADGTSYMEASELIDPNIDLAPGTMGILEPKESSIRIKDPKTIDLIVIPGLAFDKNGNRLGYGAGYYDYYLKRVRDDCYQLAISFSCQLVSSIPTEEHDRSIPHILTERGLYRID